MRVLNITLAGFRNIAESSFELGGIVALLSPNNYGKSNVLDAVSFAIDFIHASIRDRKRMMGYVGGMPLTPCLAGKDFTFLVEFEDPKLGDYRFVRYGFRFSWARDGNRGRAILDETLEINSKRNGMWSRYLKRSEGKYRAGHDTRSFRSLCLDDAQLAIDVLTSIEDIDINPAIRSIKDISFEVCASRDAASRYRPFPFELADRVSDDATVVFDDEDLPRALYRLKQRDLQRFETFRYAVLTLFPEFEDVFVDAYEVRLEPGRDSDMNRHQHEEGETEDPEVPFHIRDELYKMSVVSRYLNQPVDISMMSTGTKRIIWLVANVLIADRQGVSMFGVEEVETSIHPRMIEDLLEITDDALGDKTMLLTSHSPYLIQYLKPRNLYIGVPNDDGLASFKKLSEHGAISMIKSAQTRGFGFGEYVFSLMSSDEDALRALSSYLKD